ncbi:E3 SUMO-protein ligase ZBED1 isoform X1 [Myxocyprinus asiaticus]|uniref:E3 SUMO-protein ligase ZBED1 isoform X1 n=1 Tax=Myxocyprinus asiaticus TaxID=70543 RepID=UPI002223CB4C|nr:E3 SUMO-protein ligase ZBED1 isoform X1 [Myxocyprinus asiaticus]
MDTNIPEIEDAPSSLKSVVWKHFGLAVNYTNSGQRVVNRRKAVCRLCFTEVGCLTGSTSNLMSHLLRHHPFLSFENTPSQHRKPLSAYKQPLAAGSDRAAAITDAIGVFIAADMRPCSVVENTGFKHLLNVLDPRYKVPTREHFSSAVVPALYKQTRAVVIYELSAAPSVALTVEEWTLRATESYLTVTAHYISPDWEMKSPVLQTRPVYEHKSTNYAEKLKEVVADWSLERPRCTIPVTSDNAKNIVSAVLEAGLGPQIDCFAHTINLAAQKATAVSQVSRLLGKIRRLASFFHRSTAAAHILLTKQEMLEVSKQPLVHDVPSRWISSFDMVERYIEQQVAVHSALTEKAIKNKDIVSLTDKEMAVAEGVIEVLKPLRIIATIITESTPSVSMILPLKTRILKSMERDDGDSATVREMKAVITGNLQDRYSGDDLQEFLHKCTALDPRFKSLPHVDRACRQRIYDTLTKEIMANIEQGESTEEMEAGFPPVKEEAEEEVEVSPPPAKKSAMEELFGPLFRAEGSNKPALPHQVKEEVTSYMAIDCIPLDSNPLAWWKSNKSVYPNLAVLAKRYLAVPATSVHSERLFSAEGDVVNANRSALLSDDVDVLIFLKKNFKID